MTLTIDPSWYEDTRELAAFARALVDAELLTTTRDLLYLFDSPWKWMVEHGAWVSAGRPAHATVGAGAEPWWCFLDALGDLGAAQGRDRYLAAHHHNYWFGE